MNLGQGKYLVLDWSHESFTRIAPFEPNSLWNQIFHDITSRNLCYVSSSLLSTNDKTLFFSPFDVHLNKPLIIYFRWKKKYKYVPIEVLNNLLFTVFTRRVRYFLLFNIRFWQSRNSSISRSWSFTLHHWQSSASLNESLSGHSSLNILDLSICGPWNQF